MIRLAKLAAVLVVLVPVLAFTGDIDDLTAVRAAGILLLTILAVLGFMTAAMNYYYDRRASEDDVD